MLFILFELGTDRYALDAGQVAEVLPLTRIKQVPQAPAGVAGVLNYRGAPVPVIDLSEMMLGRPAQRRLSTRIILARYPEAGGDTRLLGLIAEKATESMRREAADFVASGVTNEEAAYLGPVASDGHGLVQWIEVKNLLSAPVREVLFGQVVGE